MSFFSGKRVFVTGGSSGIGKATAERMALAGANVVIGARGQERLERAVSDLRAVSRGDVMDSVAIDVGDRESVGRATTTVIERLGGLDILVNNAGVAQPGYIQDMPDDVFESMMRINYFGTVNTTRAFIPHMIAQRSGHVCNISSLVGYLGIFGYTAYAASKFAVSGFTDCLRQELLPHGVGVSIVFPPDTDTPQLHEENKTKPAETKAIAGTVKVLQPEDVARAIAEGIAAGRYHIVPGLGNKFSYFMYRHFPWAVRYVIDNDLKKAQSRR